MLAAFRYKGFMKNQIKLNGTDFYEEMTLAGDQTYDSIGYIIGQSVQLHDRLRQIEKPILVLIDVTEMGKMNLGAIESASIGLHNLPYDRLAAYGMNEKNSKIVHWLIRKTTDPNKVKLFDDRESAVKWLLAKDTD